MSAEHLIVRAHNGVGRLTLNRPRSLNALNHEMVVLMRQALHSWSLDDTVRVIVIDGAGERGLCAGGDLRALYDDMAAGTEESLTFWSDEYRLNVQIRRYPKPVIVLMDGFVMGAGVGLSGHASHRVVTESSVVAMPEVLIGYTPDVGGTYLLSRAPGELGTHAALTNYRMNAADAIYCGFADVQIRSDSKEDLLYGIQHNSVDDVLAGLAEAPEPSPLATLQPWIDECYSAAPVETILEQLQQHPDEDARQTANQIAEYSPTALKVTLRAVREARSDQGLEESLKREYRVSTRHHALARDFAEGIRCRLIDRARQPQWSPSTLSDVDDVLVDSFFRALGERELRFAEDAQ